MANSMKSYNSSIILFGLMLCPPGPPGGAKVLPSRHSGGKSQLVDPVVMILPPKIGQPGLLKMRWSLLLKPRRQS